MMQAHLARCVDWSGLHGDADDFGEPGRVARRDNPKCSMGIRRGDDAVGKDRPFVSVTFDCDLPEARSRWPSRLITKVYMRNWLYFIVDGRMVVMGSLVGCRAVRRKVRNAHAIAAKGRVVDEAPIRWQLVSGDIVFDAATAAADRFGFHVGASSLSLQENWIRLMAMPPMATMIIAIEVGTSGSHVGRPGWR
jgi:hypothetical protein